MKFPGKRKKKHYFPVNEKGRISFDQELSDEGVYIVGIDQLLVDIEAHVDDTYLERFNLGKGGSHVLSEETCETIYNDLKKRDLINGEYAGGSIGNTLHNYSVLSDDKSVALGCITENIKVGNYAFKYISTTNSHVDFSQLQPSEKPMGRALCFITPDKERTFAISKGCMNDLRSDFISEDLIKNSSALLVSAYLFRDEAAPMFEAAMYACEIAKKNMVPIVFSAGTHGLIEEKRTFFLKFISEYVSVLAMNETEAFALTSEMDSLVACDKALEMTDIVFLTAGSQGLYMGSYVDKMHARRTEYPLVSKSIQEYNLYEFSRAMRKEFCFDPIKTFSHINPFLGGPKKIQNTNGAGDAALSALLHDIAANKYHKGQVPNSSKHIGEFLTYSSISQICKYSNRVSYEVLAKNSPRLSRGLPEREDGLEEAYWDRPI